MARPYQYALTVPPFIMPPMPPSSVISAAGLDMDSLVSDTAASVSDITGNIFPHHILTMFKTA